MVYALAKRRQVHCPVYGWQYSCCGLPFTEASAQLVSGRAVMVGTVHDVGQCRDQVSVERFWTRGRRLPALQIKSASPPD